jgi:hypothetical protein
MELVPNSESSDEHSHTPWHHKYIAVIARNMQRASAGETAAERWIVAVPSGYAEKQ